MPSPFRADHVGSLLRPADLLAARQAQGTEASERLRELEDAHIRRVLARQQELGFEIFTDGELRRRNFMSDFTDAVDGFDLGDAVARSWKAGDAKAKTPAVSSVAGIVTKVAANASSNWTRASIPERQLPGQDQNDAAQRDAIPCDRFQIRHHGRRLQRSFRTSLGHR